MKGFACRSHRVAATEWYGTVMFHVKHAIRRQQGRSTRAPHPSSERFT